MNDSKHRTRAEPAWTPGVLGAGLGVAALVAASCGSRSTGGVGFEQDVGVASSSGGSDKGGGSSSSGASGSSSGVSYVSSSSGGADGSRSSFCSSSSSGSTSSGGTGSSSGSTPDAGVPTYAPGATVVTLASGQSPTNLVLDATSAYWVNWSDNAGPPGSVMKVPLTGGTPSTLVSNLTGSAGLAVDVNSVYVSDNLELYKVALDGGPVTLLAKGILNDPIAVGPGGVYGTDNIANSLVTVPLDGGPATTLAQGPVGTYLDGITVDDTNVYWSDFRETATVRKVPLA